MTANIKPSIKISHQGPQEKDFSKEELELLDIENLQETVYRVTFPKNLSNENLIGIADLLKLETKLPLKYLKPIQSSCIYVAQKSKLEGENKQDLESLDFEKASVQIEPMNPDWANTQIRFLPINQSIPLDTIFTISKTIPLNGNFEWVMSSDIQCTKNLKELIKQADPKAKSFVLTNRKVYLFGQDIGSRLEGKFKVSMTDDIFDSLRLFRFKRPEINIIEFIIYDFMNVSLKDILEKALLKVSSQNGKNIINAIMEAL